MTGPAPIRRSDTLPADYPRFLAEIKARIGAARTRAVLAVNSELITLYWEIGHEILEREQHEGWGARVIPRLAADLRRELPDVTGFSRSNLHYMRSFAAAWPRREDSNEIVPQAVGQLPWGHIRCLLDKLDDSASRLWYASQAVENAWSRNVLQAQIATDLRGRQGNALTSFDHALPESDSELVRDAIKDPYNFEFLGLSNKAKGATSSRPCLLRRFVVIDLKVEDFKPEFTSKMSFYLTAVDELERQPGDEPSIGLVLCPGRSKTVTEWALRTIDAPVAVARYTTGEVTLTQTPPPEMKPALSAPTRAGQRALKHRRSSQHCLRRGAD